MQVELAEHYLKLAKTTDVEDWFQSVLDVMETMLELAKEEICNRKTTVEAQEASQDATE